MTRDLLREIHAKTEIRRMAENPVMLTALACLKFSRTRLPEQRSELYDSVLEWLAKARQAKTGLDHYVLLGRMRKLAYAMHTAQKNTRSRKRLGVARSSEAAGPASQLTVGRRAGSSFFIQKYGYNGQKW